MASTITQFDPIAFRVAHRRAQLRSRRIVREAIMLGTLCLGSAFLVTALYLVAPTELREAIVTTFLGVDQPGGLPTVQLVSP